MRRTTYIDLYNLLIELAAIQIYSQLNPDKGWKLRDEISDI